ncbi:GLB1L.2 family protein [Megaselia abdita]
MENRTFDIDYQENSFLMDGKPFRYVSGSFHYFRALPETWQRHLRTMRAAGLNAVDTYVEWSFHNPKDGNYTFEGNADLERFIQLAQQEDLYVILRPGPYICAERDNGGLPYWLFQKYPNIKLRTSDEDYKREVSVWYAKMMSKMQRFMYGNGGPIIMVQVENEYGVFHACDKDYLTWLRDETEMYVQGKALLFTTDIPDERIECGKIEGVFATTDFGIDGIHKIDEFWNTLRKVQPKGPLVNSEFYPGWLVHWQEPNQRRDDNEVANALKKILEYGASVNIYMFFGGTNFGFTAGANDIGVEDYLTGNTTYDSYVADITSYDYDAPMDEAGDPTIKYLKLRNVIKDYLTLPELTIPQKTPKMMVEPIVLQPVGKLLNENTLKYLSVRSVQSKNPQSFENLDQFSGLILYEAILPKIKIDPTLLRVESLRDRAFAFVDGHFVGTLSRENKIFSLPLHSQFGKKLQLLVENQGRINFHIANDTKGIFGRVTVTQLGGREEEVLEWNSHSLPLEIAQIDKFLFNHRNDRTEIHPRGLIMEGPVLFLGQFVLETVKGDTYIDFSEWGKGVVFVNGFNLGRYWPIVGPQLTQFIPKELMKVGINEVVLVEYQRNPIDFRMKFTPIPKLDGK